MWMIAVALIMVSVSSAGAAETETLLSRGVYEPFFRDNGEKGSVIGPLAIDRDPVTNSEFLTFVKTHPQWRRSKIKGLFAEDRYLAHWPADLSFPPKAGRQPVTNVSWFAARKFCEARGRRLPTIAEWEYAADAQNPENLQIVLEWYGDPQARLGDVARRPVNARGVRGMHGHIWEWVEDFSAVIMAGDSRSSNETDRSMFCGAGALRAKDPAQYATFMRFAHRSSLKAKMTGTTLGFRCVRDIPGEQGTDPTKGRPQ